MSDFPVDPWGPHPDPLVAALIAHQRHTIGSCLCGWGELGQSHCEHVAGIIRPLVEGQLREQIALEIQQHCDQHARCCDEIVNLIRVGHLIRGDDT